MIIRHLVQDEADPSWLLRDEVQRGIASVGEAGLAFDLLVQTPQQPAAVETVRRHPDVQFVLDHVAKRRGPQGDGAWREGVTKLAALPNVACKLSGLFTEHDPVGTVALALEWFGPERCMFGSDWPVSTLACSYADTLAVVGSDPNVLARTAVEFYRLQLRSVTIGKAPVRGGSAMLTGNLILADTSRVIATGARGPVAERAGRSM